jgi:hypothetical protein
MVVAAGLLLNARPFHQIPASTAGDKGQYERDDGKRVVDYLGPWQRRIVYWGVVGIWVTLLSEAANAWWGAQWVLRIAHEAAGLKGDGPAEVWMERAVEVAHKPPAMLLALLVSLFLGCVFSAEPF